MSVLFEGRELLYLLESDLMQVTGRVTPVSSVCADSRKVTPGALFIALPGERANGEDFLLAAQERGASSAVVSASWAFSEEGRAQMDGLELTFYVVRSTLASLHRISRIYRQRLSGTTFIGVTGSAGKTTTKELIGAALEGEGALFLTKGNYNSEIGLPLMLLQMRPGQARFAVLEMGISAPGEMRALCEIARPAVAVVTNIGSAHIEMFGSCEAIAREKGSIAHFASCLFLPASCPYKKELLEHAPARVIEFSGPQSLWRAGLATAIGTPIAHAPSQESAIVPLVGEHLASDALASAEVASYLGVSAKNICARLGSFTRQTARERSFVKKGRFFFFDVYNSSPASLLLSYEAFRLTARSKGAGRAVLVLADMLELGDLALSLHKKALCILAADDFIKALILIGPVMCLAGREIFTGQRKKKIYFFEKRDLLKTAEILDNEKSAASCAVFVKGSRGWRLEELEALL